MFLSMNTSVEAVDLLTTKMKFIDEKVSKIEGEIKGVIKYSSMLGNQVDEINKQMKDTFKKIRNWKNDKKLR